MTIRARLDLAIQRLLIVPEAHTRVLDGAQQAELYEVFHTTRVARWGHAICTPVANVALLAAASRLTIELAAGDARLVVPGSIASAAIALAFYVAVHGAWALVMTVPLALSVLAAELLASALGAHAVPGALAIAAGAAWLQTMSHMPEPVPPPWSGRDGFVPVREMLRRARWSELVVLAIAANLVFPVLELWACPRIWPLQLVEVFRPTAWARRRAERLAARVREVHEDARAAWAAPPISSRDA